MKQEDKKYEEWLTEIKNRQPILENPEELTAAILNKITDNAPKKKKIRYLVGAWISGTAATLLLFLFINVLNIKEYGNRRQSRIQGSART